MDPRKRKERLRLIVGIKIKQLKNAWQYQIGAKGGVRPICYGPAETRQEAERLADEAIERHGFKI